MKKAIITSCLFLTVLMGKAQFYKGDTQINIGGGIGLIDGLFAKDSQISDWSQDTFTENWGANLSFEYAIANKLGIGIDGGYLNWAGLSLPTVGPRVSYHFGGSDKFDFYVTGGAVFRFFVTDGIDYDRALPLGRLGVRFKTAKAVGFFAEVGSGASVVQAGLSFRPGRYISKKK